MTNGKELPVLQPQNIRDGKLRFFLTVLVKPERTRLGKGTERFTRFYRLKVARFQNDAFPFPAAANTWPTPLALPTATTLWLWPTELRQSVFRPRDYLVKIIVKSRDSR